MFVFGHLGVGSKIVSPWSSGLPRRALLVGTLLPDLIDKPMYAVLGTETGLISGTRTLGHTAIFLLLMALGAIFRRSKLLAALALGMATHLFLDNLADRFTPDAHSSALVAMTWPFMSKSFAVSSLTAQSVAHGFTPFIIGSEIVGIALLGWDQWKLAHEGEILEVTRERRRFFKRTKKARKSR
jgi:membrane-bound metal-dependent hydrolase YbcI (DUF457 family)